MLLKNFLISTGRWPIIHKKTTVLILSYNGKHLLEDSISSYLENDYPNFEVIVIDNGSTDGTKEWVETNYPQVHVLRTEKNLGYSGGFNFGMEFAFNQKKSDYVVITNNDVKVDTKVISELVKVAETDDMIGFVTGKVYYYDNPTVFQTVGYETDPLLWVKGHRGHKEEDTGQYDKIIELEFSDDIFILVSRDCFIKTNGYDENFQFQAEQFDWQIRSKRFGFKLFFSPEAKIWHKESMTIGKSSAFKLYYDVRNSLVVRLKHRESEYLRLYCKYHLFSIVIVPLLKNTIKLRLTYSRAIVKGFFSAVFWGVRTKKIHIKYFLPFN